MITLTLQLELIHNGSHTGNLSRHARCALYRLVAPNITSEPDFAVVGLDIDVLEEGLRIGVKRLQYVVS
jgi:hypothetical protein